MIVLGLLLGLIIILQIFVLVGICRKNFKLDMIGAEVSKLNDVMVPAIGALMENYAHITNQLIEINTGSSGKNKHKKKKGETFYAGNGTE